MFKLMKAFGLYTRSGFKHYFNFSGRATQAEFWYFLLFFLTAYLAVWLLDHFFLPPVLTLKDLPGGEYLPAGYIDESVGLAVLAYRPIMGIPTLSITVRRLHDIGKSGWWSCLWVLPFPVIGWFWLIPWLMRPSEQSVIEKK